MNLINNKLEQYIEQHTSPESELLKKLNRETHARILRPRMLSGHLQGKFLQMISCMVNPERILEIGTYTGYSAICLSQGLKAGGKIYTIDNNAELEDFTRSFFAEAGLNSIIDYRIGEALEVLPTIQEVFDLVFIDADKENYIAYYNIAIEKLRPGGFIITDNVLWDGKVINPNPDNDAETLSIIRFNEIVQNDPRVENVIIPLRDGISIIRKICSRDIFQAEV